MQLEKDRVLPIVKAALKEDIGNGDITTSVLIDKFTSAKACIITREDCVVCGLPIAEAAMAHVDYSVRFKPNCKEGAAVGATKEIAFLEGRLNSILRAERTMLNFLSLLSGIATKTRRFADKVRPYGVKIFDTRKTLPLLRYLQRYAVFTGGGTNHRMGLYDQVLIKDNHIKGQVKKTALGDMVSLARKNSLKGAAVEIEVTTLEEFNDALAGKPDIIMLDNMSVEEVKNCIEIKKLSKFKPTIEVSGGITLDNIEEYAKAKVDMISVGSLTSSVKSIDLSLEIIS